ncbi:MAG TPA: cupredoxin domain-containing protein [Solirubrobacteraceae bacterium]|nr:cupredoxin domain-containing protein [Solirubrobacteraceae bacterium]
MHTETDQETEAKDQREFDEAVLKKGKVMLQALAGVGIVGALLMSMVALSRSGERNEASATARPVAMHAAAVAPVAAASAPAAAKVVDLKIIGSYKVGPDGKKHDAFTKTEFAVKVGQPLTLRIDNTDNAPHSITSPAVGVNIVAQPGAHTYTLLVKQAGRFQWYCMLPCDSDAHGWAMQNPGFMSGYITAT